MLISYILHTCMYGCLCHIHIYVAFLLQQGTTARYNFGGKVGLKNIGNTVSIRSVWHQLLAIVQLLNKLFITYFQ